MRLKFLCITLSACFSAPLASFAADLPVAPEPVDYVRICDAYGARFYYIPGTETCLRVGGRVRTEFRVRNFGDAENAWGDRDSDGYQWRSRGYLYLDARTSTEFGTLRAYIESYITQTNDTTATSVDHAYIQWGGLLAGRSQSNFDFFKGYAYDAQIESYSDRKANQAAYTFVFGNGFNATLAVEDNPARATSLGLNGGTVGYGGTRLPDFIGVLAISQGWGKAQIMGALHQVYPNATYNGVTGNGEDVLGWAVGAGVEVNFGGVLNGGSVALQASYTDGASGFGTTGWNSRITDAVWDGNSAETTKTLNIFGGVRLGLTDTVTANVEGGYHNADGGTTAYDFTQWSATANVVWEPVPGFIMGPELQYRDLDFNQSSGISDASEIYGTFRLQRTF
ncbi:ATP/GTP-binding site motif A (P-loop):Porin, alpha proteobacteria type [Stappia aggregata IAM 12614]|uniref:Porin n=1 Tax=Roseibium aggregatum (strain ATCC 25650 / DSM 13394 / JCM 20685 / NBRC 16684 / NCIMB 2208 / IAM 12614 / B1) TaxID=384765 RepID=A0NUB4_ROSAI|nr:porin [Roseibium aggregatum]EAV43516.1 ATP/GTP-binding site motif A (P-loop):Porin, alpha proteobacteria type [Stappia aggregata IAM 12614] [Roseibium aggregatum IAM 12614]